MQVRLIDAALVRMERARAVRQIHQNVHDEKVAGLAKKDLMEKLGIWDDDNSRNGIDACDLGDANNVCGTDPSIRDGTVGERSV